MEIDKLEEERQKCVDDRNLILNKLSKRNKLIDYFDAKKQLHLKILNKNFLRSLFSALISSLLLLGNMSLLSYFILGISFGFIGLCVKEMYICNKFNRVIKKLETNNQKYMDKWQDLLKDEVKLSEKIQELRLESEKFPDITPETLTKQQNLLTQKQKDLNI